MNAACKLSILAALAACSAMPEKTHFSEKDVDEIQAVMMRDFHARGSAKMDRIALDELQKACNLADNAPSPEAAKALEARQFSTIKFPSGSLMGDWKSGQKIAQSGRGLQWNDKPGAAGGGGCYNCHQLSPREASYGTLGPSLLGFGKQRGNGMETQRYAFGRIYNAKAYNACSHMPRLGYSGTLTEQQIKDVVAYLLDPASPVNQ
jgi:L-cysteine S-thiosulfotransferase